MTSLVRPQTQIDLRFRSVLKQGKQRDVYFLGTSDGMSTDDGTPVVLKVPRYAEREHRQIWLKRILRRLFPSSTLRIITNEVNYWKWLANATRRKGASPPIPEFIAYVETTAGPGAVWEAICDKKGNLAPTAADLADRQKLKKLVDPLNRFVAACFENSIVAPDLHLGNLACTKVNGRREVFLIDGFGDHRMVSVRALWRTYNHKSLTQSFEKIAQESGLHFDARHRKFSLSKEPAREL